MGLRRQPYFISNFKCTECKTVIPLPRREGCKRPKGHVKDLYCPRCGGMKHFVERY